MTDTLFTTAFAQTDELLNHLGLEDIQDLEDMLVHLFDRPVWVQDRHDGEPGLEVVVAGDEGAFGCCCDFPVSVVDLAEACASAAESAGTYGWGYFFPEEPPDILAMNDAELIATLQDALAAV